MWHNDEVDMIRHQAITEQREAMKLRAGAQQSQVSQPIGIAGENDLPGISSLRNMMGNIHRDNAWESSHSKNVSETGDAPAAQSDNF